MSGSTYDEFNENPRKQGASTATKVVLVLACFLGVLCLACCAGVFYAGNRVAKSFSDDPVKIREVASSILEFNPPEALPPKGSMDMLVLGVGSRMAIYGDEKSESTLIVMEIALGDDTQLPANLPINDPAAGAPDNMKHAQAQPFEQSVVQTITINGKETSIEIGTIKDNDEERVQATGNFTTKSGRLGNLILITKPSVMSQEQAIEFVRSLGTPVGEPEAKVKPTTPETPEPAEKPIDSTDPTDKPSESDKS